MNFCLSQQFNNFLDDPQILRNVSFIKDQNGVVDIHLTGSVSVLTKPSAAWPDLQKCVRGRGGIFRSYPTSISGVLEPCHSKLPRFVLQLLLLEISGVCTSNSPPPTWLCRCKSYVKGLEAVGRRQSAISPFQHWRNQLFAFEGEKGEQTNLMG